MRSGLLSASRFGKFYEDKKETSAKTIQLEKVKELTQCKITLNNERLYLLDAAGKLSCLNLKDKSVSTLTTSKLQHFHPDSHSSLSLTAVTPTSQIVHIHFQTKKVCPVFNPCLNKLVNFHKNYLTETILLAEPKTVILVDGNRKIKSIKANNDDLITYACLLGVNRFLCLLLRSGIVQIRQSSTLKIFTSFKLPFAMNDMKIATSNCGKTIAIYGKTKWLFVLSLDTSGQLNCRLAELPFQNVLQLQFTYSEQMILLGSDRILYGVYYQGQTGSLRPIFNQGQQKILTGFDVSVNQRLIALTAGKIVYLFELEQELAKVIGKAEGIAIDFSEQTSSQHYLTVGRDIQYQEEELKPQDEEKEPKEESRQVQKIIRENDLVIQQKRVSPQKKEISVLQGQQSQENLEELLQRQERIKLALKNIRGNND